MMNLLSNLPEILVAASLVCIVSGAFLGLMRGFGRSFLRCFTVFVAFVGSALACAYYVQNPERVLSMGRVQALLAKIPLLRSLGEALPELYGILLSLPVAMLAPLVFLVLFLVSESILLIVYGIMAAFIFPRRMNGRRFRPVSSILGAAVGAVQGALIALALMIPVVGLVTVTLEATEVMEAEQGASESPLTADLKGLKPMLFRVRDSRVFDYARLLRADKICDSMMRLRLRDESGRLEEIDVRDEIVNLAGMYAHAMPLLGRDVKDFGAPQAEALRRLSLDFAESDIFPRIFASLLSESCSRWGADENFLGKPPIEAEGELAVFASELYGVFAKSTAETVGEDVKTIGEILAVLAENGVFPLIGDSEALRARLARPQLLSGLTEALSANPRTRALEAALLRLAVKAFCSELLSGEQGERLDTLLGDIAAAANALSAAEPDARPAILTEALSDALTAYGYGESELSEQLVSGVAEHLLRDLGGSVGEITAEDINAFLASLEFLPVTQP